MAAACLAVPVAAQTATPPPVTPPSAPAPIGRAQIEQNLPPREAPAPSHIEVDTKGAIPALPCALADSPVPITLTGTKLTRPDGTPLAPALQALLAGVDDGLHGAQPIAVVCKIRDRVNDRLARAGYIALAQIPPQQIADGVLHLQVVTARITQVRVVGDPGVFRAALEKAVERIRSIDPLNRRDAVRELLLAGDIPGLDVNLTLSSANTAPGEMIGTLSVMTKRFALMGNLQNYGSEQLGPWIGSLRGEVYGLTGLADRTYIGLSSSSDINEVRVLQGGHDFALDSRGLRLGLRASIAWSRPTIKGLDLHSTSIIAGLDLSRPLVRSLDSTVIASGGFELLNQQSQFHASGNSIPFSRDHLRVVYARIEGDFRFTSGLDEIVHARGNVEVRKGVNAFSASRLGVVTTAGAPTRFFGNPQATVVKGEANADIHPFGPLHLDLTGFGQWSNAPLLNLEEYSVGNFTHGRGYDPGSNGGDRAYGFVVEPRVGVSIPAARVEFSGFYDWVHVQNIDPGTADPDRTLRSVGGGLRVILPQRLVVDLTYAHPLDKVLPTDKTRPSDRLLISITSKFL